LRIKQAASRKPQAAGRKPQATSRRPQAAEMFLADWRGFKTQISADHLSLMEKILRKSAFHQRKSARKIKLRGRMEAWGMVA
jgi:hypothetical protein